jgi:two-component system, OmpR family, phosphate regulon response regulator PhoB
VSRPLRANSVLLVEDEAALRELYRGALRSAGYAVVAVEDGAAALRQVEDWQPTAVVLDLALPHVDGRDVHRELKARPETRQIPIVVVSGTDMSDLEAREFASLLTKPVEPDVLVENVDKAIRRARDSRTQN